MARPTYHCRVLTLGKTHLGESDLIITALKEDGSLLRAVAKGARKPTNPFAARLEIFSVCDCLIAEGKNLHVFSEARTVDSNLHIREDFDLSAASYPIVQALAKTCHEGLEIPRLFDMSRTALSRIDSSPADIAPSITAAFLLKLFSILGFRPHLAQCAFCGEDINPTQNDIVSFSFSDGGYVCCDCSRGIDVSRVESTTLLWAQSFMMSTFSEISQMNVPINTSFSVLQLCHSWLRSNLGLNLKSLNALFAYSSAS